jgi:hypothetical protein
MFSGNSGRYAANTFTIAVISTIPVLFPQKINVANDDFQAVLEYLTNQRRRDLPVGESRQRAIKRTGNGTREAIGKLDAYGCNPRKLSLRMQ